MPGWANFDYSAPSLTAYHFSEMDAVAGGGAPMAILRLSGVRSGVCLQTGSHSPATMDLAKGSGPVLHRIPQKKSHIVVGRPRRLETPNSSQFTESKVVPGSRKVLFGTCNVARRARRAVESCSTYPTHRAEHCFVQN